MTDRDPFEEALRRHVIDRDAGATRGVADMISAYAAAGGTDDDVPFDAVTIRLWLTAMPRVRAGRLYRHRHADGQRAVAAYADAYVAWHQRWCADREALVMLRDAIDDVIDDARSGGGVDWLRFDHALTEYEYWYGADVLQHWHVVARTLTDHTATIDDTDDHEGAPNA